MKILPFSRSFRSVILLISHHFGRKRRRERELLLLLCLPACLRRKEGRTLGRAPWFQVHCTHTCIMYCAHSYGMWCHQGQTSNIVLHIITRSDTKSTPPTIFLNTKFYVLFCLVGQAKLIIPFAIEEVDFRRRRRWHCHAMLWNKENNGRREREGKEDHLLAAPNLPSFLPFFPYFPNGFSLPPSKGERTYEGGHSDRRDRLRIVY